MQVATALDPPVALSGRGCPKPQKTMGLNGLSWEYLAVNNAPRVDSANRAMSISEWQP
jgi:hypothetical protein